MSHDINGNHITVYTIEPTTVADYYPDDMVPIPESLQPQGIEFCKHGLIKNKCSHAECPFYAPHEVRVKP